MKEPTFNGVSWSFLLLKPYPNYIEVRYLNSIILIYHKSNPQID